jgi:hypothetical protein
MRSMQLGRGQTAHPAEPPLTSRLQTATLLLWGLGDARSLVEVGVGLQGACRRAAWVHLCMPLRTASALRAAGTRQQQAGGV